jgi:sugar O-acyltransferase (sialic acid O-acetyltransferase NeuD family)
MSDSFFVVGAGGHAKVVIDALISSGCRVKGCFDDNSALSGLELVPGVRVLGNTSLVDRKWKKGSFVIVGIGDNTVRRRLSLRWEVDYGVAKAQSVVLGKGVKIGKGAMLLPSATINIDTVIGNHAILNTSCSVDHDCRIGDYAHIAPGCCLGGGITIGEGAFLGVGTGVIPGIRIGRWSVIGAGAVVTKDLPDNCTAVGVPAKVIKVKKDGWHLQ